MDWLLALKAAADELGAFFGLRPRFGVELEFYLSDPAIPHATVQGWMAALKGVEVLPERGPGQWELVFPPMLDAPDLAARLEWVREHIQEAAQGHGAKASFEAKPHPTQPGSGMHVHLSLEDLDGEPQFYKRGELFSAPMRHALAGLLAALPESARIFAPHAESYQRFDGSQEAPLNISWGPNNRTTALRIPDSLSGFRTIEHRVPGADAPAAPTLLAIMAGALHGLRQTLEPPEAIFGNAFDAQYAGRLTPLPEALDEARALYANGQILPEYFGEGWAEWLPTV